MATTTRRFLTALVLGTMLSLQTLAVQACDKHPQGHQNSSETDTDYSQRR